MIKETIAEQLKFALFDLGKTKDLLAESTEVLSSLLSFYTKVEDNDLKKALRLVTSAHTLLLNKVNEHRKKDNLPEISEAV